MAICLRELDEVWRWWKRGSHAAITRIWFKWPTYQHANIAYMYTYINLKIHTRAHHSIMWALSDEPPQTTAVCSVIPLHRHLLCSSALVCQPCWPPMPLSVGQGGGGYIYDFGWTLFPTITKEIRIWDTFLLLLKYMPFRDTFLHRTGLYLFNNGHSTLI